MTREFSRVQRVADQMQRELAQLIQLEVKDPRLGMVTVNAVKVSRDFGYADVYVTVLEQEEGSEALQESLRVLKNAAGFLRGRLARQIKLRTVPALRFHYDSSVVRGQQLSSLIDRAVAQDRSRQQGDSEE